MDWRRSNDSAERFSAYLEEIGSVMGHAARVAPMRDYCSGLLLDCERKSAEPIAAATAPHATSAKHQSLLHFLAKGEWSDEKVLGKVRDLVLPQVERHGPVEAWIVDDTGFPKCGSHSVGVSHQYCGQLGKQANCQVAVSLSVANHAASLPVAYRLYLPESWAKDEARRKKAGVPERIEFQTKPKIALQQIEWACAAGIPRGVVLMDCAYGADLSLRRRLTELELTYAVGVWARTLVRKATRSDATGDDAAPVTAVELAKSLPKRAWRTIGWRDGTNARLASRFTRVRVCVAGEGTTRDEPEEWLIVEWPKDEEGPTKFWLSTLPEDTTFERMIDSTMLRWRIERDYQELKQEVGLGHFEGRSWRGFHHHATMCIAAYGFLIAERGAFPPSAPRPRHVGEKPALPEGYRPRGSPAPARAPCSPLDRNAPTPSQCRPARTSLTLPLLRQTNASQPSAPEILTQYD
jgi:SRSO17 transposase